MNHTGTLIVALACGLLLPGCGSMSNTAAGAGIGAVGGAVLGGVAGHNIPGVSTTGGAVAGGLVGGLLGGVLGNQQDQINAQEARVQAAEQQASTMVVNIRNSNGSTTPVILRRVGNQWGGPRGEIYDNMPTEEQLRPVYGF